MCDNTFFVVVFLRQMVTLYICTIQSKSNIVICSAQIDVKGFSKEKYATRLLEQLCWKYARSEWWQSKFHSTTKKKFKSKDLLKKLLNLINFLCFYFFLQSNQENPKKCKSWLILGNQMNLV